MPPRKADETVEIVASVPIVTTPAPTAAGTATHTTDVAVDATSGGVTLKAANANRKSLLIQNTGAGNMRVSYDGTAPTATHGVQVPVGGSLVLEMPYCPTVIVKAIREGATSTSAAVTEVV